MLSNFLTLHLLLRLRGLSRETEFLSLELSAGKPPDPLVLAPAPATEALSRQLAPGPLALKL